jgi:glycosyltransferase involved in cell wall biosynthesis
MTPQGTGSAAGRRVLFLEKAFLARREHDPRGVELFNLNLVRDLARLGCRVTVLCRADWAGVVRERGGDVGQVEAQICRGAGLAATLGLMGRRFDALLLANVANRLVPHLALLRMLRVAPRCVLIAHREPSRRSVQVQRLWPSTVVAVNRQIAGHFERAGFPRVAVSYGITDADRFAPLGGGPAKETVDFCVVGHLDSAWKGADTAMAAFARLSPAARARCRLHLASYSTPPVIADPTVRAYPWMPFARVPSFLHEMDVMLVPSRDEQVMRETFCQAMVQGMLTGLPTVTSALPVLTEKLDAGGGIVCTNVDEITAAIERLAADAAARRAMGARGREVALARYVWDTAAFVNRFLFPTEAAPERT